MQVKLEDCTLITGAEYMALVDPEFVGQTRVNGEGNYYMCWLSAGQLYKTCNQL